MPQAGTRKILVRGQEIYLPEHEARVTELLRQGCRLQQRLDATKRDLDVIKEELAEIATQKRGDKATVHLSGVDGQAARVVWRREIVVDAQAAESLRATLGRAWSRLFNTRTTYTLARGYQSWMRAPQGAHDQLKKKIAAAFAVREKKPAVQLIDATE